MVRGAREYELKALLTDSFGGRAAAATVERLNAHGYGGPGSAMIEDCPAGDVTSRDRRGRAAGLVGDHRQLRAVEADRPFGLLQDAGMPTATRTCGLQSCTW